MKTRDYLTKIYADLQDHSTCKLFIHNPTNGITHDARTLTHCMYYCLLLPFRNTRTALFYGLSKIHKPSCPLRPIVSGCDGPTDNLSFYITHFIQPPANNLRPHIKDTKNFLNLIKNLPPLTTNALLVTADVTSLHSNIQHDDSVSAIIHFMEK